MRPNKDGMVARVVVENRRITRVSLVPVTRDAQNNVQMLDPSSGEGEKKIQKVMSLSGNLPLKIEGKEAVLLDE